jgi:threonine/homoserine/homoserine lactone efflux protein
VSQWTIFATAFLVGLSGAVTPGPVLALTISETAKRGWIAVPLIVFGHAILEGTLVVCLVAGLGAILLNGRVLGPIAMVGACVLFWMGALMVRDSVKHRAHIDLSIPRQTTNVGKPILGGLLMSLANPYWIVWWATVGLAYIGASLERGAGGVLSFFTGHILSDFGWYSVVGITIVGGRRLFIERAYTWVNLACGCFLIGIGGYFFWFGISRVLESY